RRCGSATCPRPKGWPGARRCSPTTVSASSLRSPCNPCEPISRRPPPENNRVVTGLPQRRSAGAYQRCASSRATYAGSPRHARLQARHRRLTSCTLAGRTHPVHDVLLQVAQGQVGGGGFFLEQPGQVLPVAAKVGDCPGVEHMGVQLEVIVAELTNG